MRNNNNEPLTPVWQNGGFGAKMNVSASKSATSPSRKPLWASIKPKRRSAKANGLITQCDRQKSGDKKTTLKTGSIPKSQKSNNKNLKNNK